MTVDHFQPKSKDGTDDVDNLIYCCISCNQYKFDYWPANPGDPILWNPRHESISDHLILLDNGNLHFLTPTGQITIKRLRLNRPPLIAYRLRQQHQAEETRILLQFRNLIQTVESLQTQLSSVLEEQQLLLNEQRRLMKIISKKG